MTRNYSLRRLNVHVPTPVAAAVLGLALIGTGVLVFTDRSTAGLPPPGAPGRYDEATATYYRQYRLQLEADKKRFFEQHPELKPYRNLPADEIAARIRHGVIKLRQE